MDEAKRFLRYIVPGILFLVESLLLIWILLPAWPEDQVKALTKEAGLGFALAGILGSGGLGFVFSVLHHWLHWCPWFEGFSWRGGVDFRGALSQARSSQSLKLVDATNVSKTFAPEKVPTRFEAWVILTALWHERRLTSKTIEGAEPRASSLADLMHSMGTGRVATAAALLFALAVANRVGEMSLDHGACLRALGMVIAWLILLSAHQGAYKRTSAVLELFVGEVLHDALAQEKPEKPLPNKPDLDLVTPRLLPGETRVLLKPSGQTRDSQDARELETSTKS